MVSIDSCYFCTTPYQIIGAISLAEQQKETADLYIVGQFASFLKVAESIESLNLFHRVIPLNENEVLGKTKTVGSKLVRKALMFFQYFRVDDIGSRYIDPAVTYKKMYFTSQAFAIRLFQFYLMRKSKEIRFVHFDDGVGSYFKSKLFRVARLDRFLRQVILGNGYSDYPYEKLLYNPELYDVDRTDGSPDHLMISLGKMPIIEPGGRINQKLNAIFGFQTSDIIEERVMIFDTLVEALYGTEGLQLWGEHLNMIQRSLGAEQLILKKHPRDPRASGIHCYPKHEMPSELLFLNSDIGQKVLIAINSTAVITPKLIMDAEPVVILLYKLYDNKLSSNEIEDVFFRKIKDSYRSSERFYIPKTSDELENILKEISGV